MCGYNAANSALRRLKLGDPGTEENLPVKARARRSGEPQAGSKQLGYNVRRIPEFEANGEHFTVPLEVAALEASV